jgi:3-oxoacyl-[acyl-carrier-protein] synthase-1
MAAGQPIPKQTPAFQMSQPVAILASGMVTAVGLDAPSSCAAIRCGIDGFSQTRFTDKGGEWIIGAQAPLDQPWRGLPKLVHMVVPAIRECLAFAGQVRQQEIPLILCVAEKERPGRLEGLDDELFETVQIELGFRFHPSSGTLAKGRVGGAIALQMAQRIIHEQSRPLCMIAGVDTFLVAATLAVYEEKSRLLTRQNSNGFIPGEAGGAVLVGPAGNSNEPELRCLGIGTGQERATVDSEEPLRGDGLVQAIKAAFDTTGCLIDDLDYRITDSNGEQYWFKEATLALDRILRKRKELFEIWHPADCLGEIGAAIGPCVTAIALQAARRNYAFGRGPLCHFSAENSERLAVVLNYARGRNN